MPNPIKNGSEHLEKMMPLSLTQAAKAAKISKSTLSVAIQKGRVSAVQLPDGSYEIEPAELFRVFAPKTGTTRTEPGVRPATEPRPNHAEPTRTNIGSQSEALEMVEVEVLRVKLQTLEAQVVRDREDREREREKDQDTIADLRKRLDSEQEERRALQRQLMPPEKPQEADKSPAVVEELQKRLGEAEARIAALATPPSQERPVEVHTELEQARAQRGFLRRLLGW